jgi:hypothetical protein
MANLICAFVHLFPSTLNIRICKHVLRTVVLQVITLCSSRTIEIFLRHVGIHLPGYMVHSIPKSAIRNLDSSSLSHRFNSNFPAITPKNYFIFRQTKTLTAFLKTRCKGSIFRCYHRIAKNTFSFVMSICLSVRPSVRNNLAPTGRIFMKFYTWVFFKMCREILSFIQIWQE